MTICVFVWRVPPPVYSGFPLLWTLRNKHDEGFSLCFLLERLVLLCVERLFWVRGEADKLVFGSFLPTLNLLLP
ncbi:hypothetical protein STEG23_031601 [Scotinomys teguina]